MSKITFYCPGCRKKYTVDQKLAGKKANCKQCSAPMQVPNLLQSRPSQASATDSEQSKEPPRKAILLPPKKPKLVQAQVVDAEPIDKESPPPTTEPTEVAEVEVAEVEVAEVEVAEVEVAEVEVAEVEVAEVEVAEVEVAEVEVAEVEVAEVEVAEVLPVVTTSQAEVVSVEVVEDDAVDISTIPEVFAVEPVANRVASEVVTPVVVTQKKDRRELADSIGTSNLTPEEWLAAIHTAIEPVPTTLSYRLSAFAVACLMVILPLIYVGLIGLVAYLLFLHATESTAVFDMDSGARSSRGQGKAFVFKAFLYITPLIMGALTLVFMIKPLFAKSAKPDKSRSLNRKQDPLLFAFVERLCEAVHAPKPKRIDIDCDVNASASYRRGLFSVFFSNDLVLTIGMPLVAGLTARQLGGVLAHEFGHFSQGFGMRMSYLIRTISFWFARVVYERDRWDEWLANTANSLDLRIGIVLHLSRFLIWLTRRVLWVLMMVGNVFSCFLLRQMEYDADLHEIRFSGSDNFRKSTMQLRRLGVAYHQAMADQQGFFMDGKLGNDMPLLTAFNRDSQDEAFVRKIFKGVMDEETELLATHPVDKDRVAKAKEADEEGVFQLDAPASALFSNFPAACQSVTRDFFQEVFGDELKPNMLVPAEQLISHKRAAMEAGAARVRMFGHYFRVPRQIDFPTAFAVAGDIQQASRELRAAREQMISSFEGYDSLSKQFDEVDTKWLTCHQVAAILDLGVKLKQKDFDIPVDSAASARQAGDRYRVSLSQMNEHLKLHENAFISRVSASIQLVQNRQFQQQLDSDILELLQTAQTVCSTLPEIQATYAEIVQLRNQFACLTLLLNLGAGGEMSEEVVKYVLNMSRQMAHALTQLQLRYQSTNFPFAHADGEITLAQYLIPKTPASEEVGDVAVATEKLLDQYNYVYFRCIGELSHLCQAVEQAIGLEPQPEPPEPEPEPDDDEK